MPVYSDTWELCIEVCLSPYSLKSYCFPGHLQPAHTTVNIPWVLICPSKWMFWSYFPGVKREFSSITSFINKNCKKRENSAKYVSLFPTDAVCMKRAQCLPGFEANIDDSSCAALTTMIPRIKLPKSPHRMMIPTYPSLWKLSQRWGYQTPSLALLYSMSLRMLLWQYTVLFSAALGPFAI